MTSPATIFHTHKADDVVQGIAVAMTDEEISSLDPFEGYPNVYNRQNLDLVTYDSDQNDLIISAQAYIRVKPNEPFVYPCPAYQRQCCKTIYSYRKLMA